MSPIPHRSSTTPPMPLDMFAGTSPSTVGPTKAIPNDVPKPSSSPQLSNGSSSGSDNNDMSPNGEIDGSSITPIVRTASSLSIRTSGANLNKGDDQTPQSVIHAPTGFPHFRPDDSPQSTTESTSSSSQRSDVTVTMPAPPTTQNADRTNNTSPVSPPPITTQVAPAQNWTDRGTPRAQTRQEVENLNRQPRKSNLEDIPETIDAEVIVEETEDESEPADLTIGNFQETEEELRALKTALDECWTLCNTLASLSHIHRERLFNFSGRGDMQEQAWKSCWKLCQNLYYNRENDYRTNVQPTLDLCRDFCQALFDVRSRDDEVADSVLRVSFELNNHLYNTHDRNLPEAFRERTMDFYITLCHRLMKQRNRLAEETDSLLRACWSLVEMLFSLRQSKREGKKPDEELLGSAVQACWELCDLFREGWTQIRPDRRTPRASQTTFTQAFYQAQRSAEYPPRDEIAAHQMNPETPTTIFEDTATVSPDEVPVPNIVVLGHSQTQQWSSNSSTLSGYSRSSEQTSSSTHTVRTPSEDPNLTCLKLLIVRAAMNSGFQRGASPNLSSFAKSLPSDSFGSLQWQRSLLDNYKKLVVFDPAFRIAAPPARALAMDVARAVEAMVQHDGQYAWLRDLYRLVFGFHADESNHRKTVAIQT
ncbi:hypothetical protein AJ80_04044 [Polytolypa hystricis UAMH7299]|uniref:DUF7624 domain-containing protein n=1 Tax=Polytolypa hystricis (strain UAMH7299) TaxID=1447883 RepID=A0A2B7YE12_POLH7|nr:hypothetical protein AJ80_04044 [Polytolypa hystricis UAMH7299]